MRLEIINLATYGSIQLVLILVCLGTSSFSVFHPFQQDRGAEVIRIGRVCGVHSQGCRCTGVALSPSIVRWSSKDDKVFE